MMKRTLLIVIFLIIAVLAATIIALLFRPNDDVPEFSYPDKIDASLFYPSQNDTSISTAETSTTADSSGDESELSFESTETPEKAQNEAVLTSNDPLHCFRLSTFENTVFISGTYISDNVTHIEIDGNEFIPHHNGYELSAEIKFSAENGFYPLKIHLENGGYLGYRIRSENKSLSIVSCPDIVEQNRLAADAPLIIPESAVQDYIVTGGTQQEITDQLNEIRHISDNICDGISDDYDKARALAAWVSVNYYYDYKARDNGVTTETLSIARTLELKRSVCGGYANLYAALCQAQGIECHIIQGTVVQNGFTFAEEHEGSPSHEWNLVIIDGRHIWVDTLWNTSNTYTARKGYSDGAVKQQYFDITDEILALNHKAARCEIRDFFAATR
ncbi:MAG: transglutaminase domain-containing protein [Oscillospiraceae bacterium]|nr:transglutaminase domain-containing protein [Oscillospiraceae bacterium]